MYWNTVILQPLPVGLKTTTKTSLSFSISLCIYSILSILLNLLGDTGKQNYTGFVYIICTLYCVFTT